MDLRDFCAETGSIGIVAPGVYIQSSCESQRFLRAQASAIVSVRDPGGNVPHIGILVDTKSPQSGRYMVVHNIGRGPKMQDLLFDWKITGNYSYGGLTR